MTEMVHLYTTQLGIFTNMVEVANAERQNLRGMATYKICYPHPGTTVISNGIALDLAARQTTIKGRDTPDEPKALFKRVLG